MTSVSVADVLVQIDEIFNSASIDEVGVIVAAPDAPPVVHVNEKLGIAHTIIKPMFKYVVESLSQLNTTIGDDRTALSANSKAVLSLTRMLLLIKGDFPLAYKLRKQLIELDLITISAEIDTMVLIFARTPKTPSGWFHRRWCLSTHARRKGRTLLSAPEIESERELCRRFAESSPKNYYCWMHRLWLLDHMTDSQLVDELSVTHDWLVSHVSDHSACSHRNEVIYLLSKRLLLQPLSADSSCGLYSQLVDGSDDITHAPYQQVYSFLLQCVEASSALIGRRPGHEALWYHRRSLLLLMAHLVKALMADQWSVVSGPAREIPGGNEDSECVRSKCASLDPLSPASSGVTISEVKTCILSSSNGSALDWLYQLLECEVGFCRACIENREVWDYEAQRAMALRYAAFLFDMVRCCVEESHSVVDLKVLGLAKRMKESMTGPLFSCRNETADSLHKICYRSYEALNPHVKNCNAVYRS